MNRQAKLFRYSASAGSGKTHALTGFYLSRVLNDPSAYRRILAVTFTNSAAAEMKSRILSRLDKLCSEKGIMEEQDFIGYLCENFPELYPDRNSAEKTIGKNAPLALRNILRDYSRFTVGTIDSFFQRIIRAFAREIDIPAGYEIELEHEILLGNAVDEILYQVSADSKLKTWISSYVASRLDDNRNWDIRREIMDVAGLIFGEKFRQLTNDDRKKLGDYDVLQQYAAKIFSIKNGFESELKALAAKGVRIYESCGLTVDDFANKDKGGVGAVLFKLSGGKTDVPGKIWRKAVDDSRFLPQKSPAPAVAALDAALAGGLLTVMNSIDSLFERGYRLYVSALVQQRTIHVMGILGAISEKVRTLAHDENLFLLSDSGELINKLIADDDAPFIYEKIGTAYDHFIIDEFQDTSQIQWQNFMPLINETLSRGNDNLVVGDVKQSIYRWRNSDWRILHSEVTKVFGSETVKTMPLNVNFRSRANIIKFNNHIFRPQAIPALCDSKLANENLSLSSVYSGSEQTGTMKRPGGLVKVTIFPRNGEERWKESVLRQIPELVEQLQDNGYSANDIMFLCRTNEEGKSIINSILEHSSGCSAEKLTRYNFEVTSGESLYLERNPAVSLLLACLRYMVDPGNRINKSLMVRSFALATGADEAAVYSADAGTEIPAGILPDGWEESLNDIRNSSLFTAAEKMILFFGLGNAAGDGKGRENVAYINSFQDVVLWYSSRYSSDISSFVSWWETEGYRKTVAQSDRQEAIRVMTIHKAKGLQSRVVIIPFASWEFSRHGFSRPLLWVRNVPEQFAPMPVVLPELSAQVENSYFAEAAALEKASEWLDGINMLYVAFTRPVDALFIMAPEDRKSESINANTESLLINALADGIGEARWTESGNLRSLTLGELPVPEKKQEKGVITMDRYPVSERRGTMRLRTGGALPLDEIKLDEPGGRAYGIMMHELLSRVKTLDDIPKAVDHVCDRGLMNNTQRGPLTEKVRLLLTSQKVKEWFDGSSAVRTEATIILPTGAARRPDRVMTRDGILSVLDFKFGEPSEEHVMQAAGYRHLLEEMGYNGVKAWLWYVEKDLLREA